MKQRYIVKQLVFSGEFVIYDTLVNETSARMMLNVQKTCDILNYANVSHTLPTHKQPLISHDRERAQYHFSDNWWYRNQLINVFFWC